MGWIDFADIGGRTLTKALRDHAETIGDRDFLVFDRRAYSYAESNAAANSYAQGLASLGVRAGDPVAILSKTAAEVYLLTFGALKLGAFFVPVNTDLRGELLADHLGRSEARVLVLDAQLANRVAPIWDMLPFKTVLLLGERDGIDFPGAEVIDVAELGKDLDAPEPAHEVKFSDLASVMWSSGTTGPSKGIMASHHLWVYSAYCFDHARGARDGAIFYGCLPAYNAGAWVLGAYAALACGGTCGLDDRFTVSGFWDRIRHYGATQTATLGAMHMYLWQQPERPGDSDHPLEGWYALPLPGELHEPFRRRFGVKYLLQSGGQSECMGWSLSDATGATGTPGSAGFLREDVEIKLVDEDGIEVPTGQPGEALVRSKVPYAVFSGYYREPERTLAAWQDLWHHSGDIYKYNEQGELFFVDRKSDYIRYKGRNISSFDAEKAIERHPAVSEAAVVGIPSADLDSESELLAFVVLRDSERVEPADLARFVNDTSAYFLVPRYITFASELPQTPTGRVQKHRLRQAGLVDGVWDAVADGFTATK